MEYKFHGVLISIECGQLSTWCFSYHFAFKSFWIHLFANDLDTKLQDNSFVVFVMCVCKRCDFVFGAW